MLGDSLKHNFGGLAHSHQVTEASSLKLAFAGPASWIGADATPRQFLRTLRWRRVVWGGKLSIKEHPETRGSFECPVRGNVAGMLLNARAGSPHVESGRHRSRAIHCRPGGRQPVQLSREGWTPSALDPLWSRQLLTNTLSNSHCVLHRPAMLLDADV